MFVYVPRLLHVESICNSAMKFQPKMFWHVSILENMERVKNETIESLFLIEILSRQQFYSFFKQIMIQTRIQVQFKYNARQRQEMSLFWRKLCKFTVPLGDVKKFSLGNYMRCLKLDEVADLIQKSLRSSLTV